MQTHSRAVWKPRVNPLSFLNTNSYRISGLDRRTSKSSNCWEHNTVTCGSGKCSLWGCSCEQGLISGHGRPYLMWVRTATILLLTCTCCSGCPRWVSHTVEPLGAATGIYPKKNHTKSHLFHHHLKEREGNLCKVLKGAGQWWWLHRHGPSQKFHQNPGHHCSVGSRGAAKLTLATAPMRNRAKQQGKKTFTSDRRLHLISREHRELPPE